MWFVDLLQKLATGGAAAVGAWVAVRGLDTWRRQLHGNAEYDLARRILRAVFKVRDEISFVRAPFVSVGEMAVAYEEAGIDPKEVDFASDARRRDQLVYQRRWKPLAGAVSDLSVEILEGEVLWGSGVKELGEKLQAVVGELNAAIYFYFREVHAGEQRSAQMRDLIEKQWEIIYSRGRDDPFRLKVEAVAAEFETILRPHLHAVSVKITTRVA